MALGEGVVVLKEYTYFPTYPYPDLEEIIIIIVHFHCCAFTGSISMLA